MRGQKHDTFSKEFHEEAIRKAREEQRPLTALARDLGVKYPTLRLWVKQATEAEHERPARGADLLAENRRLRSPLKRFSARFLNCHLGSPHELNVTTEVVNFSFTVMR